MVRGVREGISPAPQAASDCKRRRRPPRSRCSPGRRLERGGGAAVMASERPKRDSTPALARAPRRRGIRDTAAVDARHAHGACARPPVALKQSCGRVDARWAACPCTLARAIQLCSPQRIASRGGSHRRDSGGDRGGGYTRRRARLVDLAHTTRAPQQRRAGAKGPRLTFGRRMRLRARGARSRYPCVARRPAKTVGAHSRRVRRGARRPRRPAWSLGTVEGPILARILMSQPPRQCPMCSPSLGFWGAPRAAPRRAHVQRHLAAGPQCRSAATAPRTVWWAAARCRWP
jgi:hypothetical protein